MKEYRENEEHASATKGKVALAGLEAERRRDRDTEITSRGGAAKERVS